MGTHTKPRRRWPWIVAAIVVTPIATVIALGAANDGTTTVQGVNAPAPTVAPWPTLPAPIVPVPQIQAAPSNQFGAGTYEVGQGPGQIQPGKYHTAHDGGGMGYWARLKDTSGDTSAIIANGIVNGPTTITVKPGDAAVHFSGSDTWTLQQGTNKS